MIALQNTRKAVALLALFLIGAVAMAAEIKVSERLAILSNVPVSVNDNATVTVPPTAFAHTDHSVANYLTLGIDHDYPKLMGTSYNSIAVDVLVTPLVGTAFTQTLTIEYRPYAAVSYKDQDKHAFSGANSFTFTITGITLDGTAASQLPEQVYLEGSTIVDRTYHMNGALNSAISVSSSTVDLDFDFTADELELTWGTVVGAEEYQLEWVFVNDYTAAAGSYSVAGLAYDFKRNSTRITTAETYYRIPLVFDHGYVLYRVRAVGRDQLNPSKAFYTVWSFPDQGLVSDPGVLSFHNTTPHESAKNWQITTSFAEEGKKKETMNYMDGTLRSRQELASSNTDQNVIVGQTLYDYQGRPAVSVLPAPVVRPTQSGNAGQAALKYYDNFNQKDNGSGAAYDRDDFDLDASGNLCTTPTAGMGTTSGASNYYSPQNPNQQGQQAFVPDGQKYPFAQTEYEPDNSGRIRRVSGVGPDHQLDSGHETKYIYGKPFQIQLDRLFASEVGQAAHYQKNAVIDANGQISVSYVDMGGNTVATALAGDGTTNLAPLSSSPGTATSFTVDLFEEDANGTSLLNTLNPTGDALVFSQVIVVTTGSNYNFTYDLSVDRFLDPCLAANVCFHCVYQLDIVVTDDCGDIVTNPPAAINQIMGNIIPGPNGPEFIATCVSPATYSDGFNFNATLNPGSYTVSKVLTLLPDAVDYYTQAYLDPTYNSCVKTLEDFENEFLDEIDTSDCYLDCDLCVDALGDRDDFIAQGKGSSQDYDLLVIECMQPCQVPTRCDIAFEQMLVDMAPGGQYGVFQDNQGAYIADPLSVYNPGNFLLASNAYWQTPEVQTPSGLLNCYLDAFGDSSKVSVVVQSGNFFPAVVDPMQVHRDQNNNTLFTYPHNLSSLDDFVALWEPSWAKSLVRFHPEYCYYVECQGYVAEDAQGKSSESFDILLRTTDHAAAITAGLLDVSGTAPTNWFVTSNAEYDPFVTSGNYTAFATDLVSRFNNYLTIGTTSYSMAEAAAIVVRCGNQVMNQSFVPATCTTFGTNPATVDDEWQMLANLYVGEKQKLKSQYEDEQAIINGCYNDCIGNPDFDHYANNFFSFNLVSGLANSPYFDPNQPCSIVRKHFFQDKVKRFSDHDDLPNSDPNSVAYQMYLMTGQCPNATNLQSVLNAVAGAGQLTATNHDIAVYAEYGALVLSMTNNQGSVQPTFWQAAASGNVLDVDWVDGSSNLMQTISLDHGGQFAWSDVVAVMGLDATGFNGSVYSFDLVVGAVTNSTFTQYTITGTTTVNVLNCFFDSPCEGNELAQSIEDVMTVVHNQGQLQGSYAFSSFPTMYPVVTLPLQNTLASTAANMSWSYNSGTNTYSINTSNSNFRIDLVVQSSNPAIFNNWAGITYFNHLRPDGNNGFIIEGWDGSNQLVSLFGEAFLVNTSTGAQSPLDIGDCSLPPGVACDSQEHILREDLEAVLHDVLLQTPFNANINLFASPAMTTTLAGAFPQGSTQTTGTITIVTDPSTGTSSETLELITTGCTLSLSTNPGFSLVDLTTLGTLVATGPVINNAMYDFYMTATFEPSPGVFVTDMVFGTGCIPLMNCEPCPNLGSGAPAQPLDNNYCKVAYANFLNAIVDFNNSAYATTYGITMVNPYPTYNDFVANVDCQCGQSYADYLANYTVVDGGQLNDPNAPPVVIGGGYTGHPLEIGDYNSQYCNPPPPCDNSITVTQPIPVPYQNPCVQQMINMALSNAQNAYDQYVDSLSTDFASRYRDHCMGVDEDLTTTYVDKEHHFTLYYYDQAGNLIKTVPPEGVEVLGITSSSDPLEQQIIADRANGTQTVFTEHRMATNYLFNSLNQQVARRLPDHDGISLQRYELSNGLDDELDIHAVQFVNASRGYLSGTVRVNNMDRGLFYKTDDGGRNWQRIDHLVASDFNGTAINNLGIGLTVGDDGTFLFSMDNGSSWDKIDLFQYDITADLNDVAFDGSFSGVVVGDNATVVKAANNVVPQTVTSSDPGFPISSNDHFQAVMHDNGTYYTVMDYTDASGKRYGLALQSAGAAQWTPLNSVKADALSAVSFYAANAAVATGPRGLVMTTDDAGLNWMVVPSNLTDDIGPVYFKDAQHGIALVGTAGSAMDLYRTSTGGTSWQQMTTGSHTYHDLYHYYDGQSGASAKVLAAGPNGVVERVIVQNNAPYGVAAMSTIPGFDAQAVAGTMINNKLIAVVGGNDANLWFTVDGEAANSNWNAFNTGVSGLDVADIQVLNISGDLMGVLRTTGGDLYSLLLDLSGTTPVMTFSAFTNPAPGTNNFTALAADELYDRFIAYNQTDGRAYRIITQTGMPVQASADQLVMPNGPGVMMNALDILDGSGKALSVGSSGHSSYGEPDPMSLTGAIFWTDRSNNVRPPVQRDLTAIGSGKLLSVGDHGSYIDIDLAGGASVFYRTGSNQHLYGVAQSATDIALAVGANGAVLRLERQLNSTFGLTSLSSGTTVNLHDIALGATEGYIVGESGSSLYLPNHTSFVPSILAMGSNATLDLNGATIDGLGGMVAVGARSRVVVGGNTAATVNKQVFAPYMEALHFRNAQEGYAVGKNYTVRYTNDGGNNWSVVLPQGGFAGGVPELRGVATLPNGEALLCGMDEYLARVSNGVAVGQNANLAGVPDLMDIAFVDGQTGYLVGGSTTTGIAAKTTDGGATWTNIALSGTVHNLNALEILPHNGTFVAAGIFGGVAYFDGSTLSASAFSTGLSDELHDLCFVDATTGYVVGDNGTFLKTDNVTVASGLLTGITWGPITAVDDLNNQLGASNKQIRCIDFAESSPGFIGGNFTPGNPYGYARLLFDQSGRYSEYFWYDRLGRSVVSQNSKQYNAATKRYAYLKYDALGRTLESGEKTENTGNVAFEDIFGTFIEGQYNANTIDDGQLAAWIAETSGARKEVRAIYYDEVPAAIGANLPVGFAPDNLRKRIASSTYEETFDNDPGTYQQASHYDYDIHGNARSVVKENQRLAATGNVLVAGQRYKRTDYEYDLISGNTHAVRYQDGQPDAWHHHYRYDADNRLTHVFTSRDGVTYDQDGRYLYYEHGPLARKEMGEHNVQGTDFVYTLQGWIKGLNSDALDPTRDAGKDGDDLANTANPNAVFARDAVGLSLGYYTGDYQPIDNTSWATVNNRFAADLSGSDLLAARNDLYNGNIGHSVTTITEPTAYAAATVTLPSILPQGVAYQYDQLNRLIEAQAYDNLDAGTNTWQTSGSAYNGRYHNTFVYDANGNIEQQLRKDGNGTVIDDLTYHYAEQNGHRTQNRLYHVNDNQSNTALYHDDIDDMGAFSASAINSLNNYRYDEIGQLMHDEQEDIEEIIWTVDHKVRIIRRVNGSDRSHLVFDYDETGQRVAKSLYANDWTWEKTSYYVRDGGGQVMAIYDYTVDNTNQTSSYLLTERNIYGGERLGMYKEEVEMIAQFPLQDHHHQIGARLFECSNHLGNVLAVVTDRKMAVDDDADTFIDYYQPEITLSQDYSPFGVMLYERRFARDSVCITVNDTTTTSTTIELQDFDNGNTNGWSFGVGTYTTASSELRIESQLNGNGQNEINVEKAYAGLTPGEDYELEFEVTNVDQPVSASISDANGTQTVSFTQPGSHTLNLTPGGTALTLSVTALTGKKLPTSLTLDNLELTHEEEHVLDTVYKEPVNDYRYAFNGMEKDDEVKGLGNSYTTLFRQYDTRLGRWLSLDPKFIAFESPFAGMANNPIVFNDPNGDHIPIRFENMDKSEFDKQGVPKMLQKMFNEEYGIKVRYNSETQALEYDGEIATSLIVSEGAKKRFVDALKAPYHPVESNEKYGTWVVGNDLRAGGEDIYLGTVYAGKTFIDLSDFSQDLSVKGANYREIPIRAHNLGRVVEHEWMGHRRDGKLDPTLDRRFYTMGGTVKIVNNFRNQIGLEEYNRVSYSGAFGIVWFGKQFDNEKVTIKKVKEDNQLIRTYNRQLNKWKKTPDGKQGINKPKRPETTFKLLTFPSRD